MTSRLLNVRLTEEDERLVKQLRDRGVSMSELVRQALRDAAGKVEQTAADPAELEAEMLRLYPTPRGAKVTRPDARNRQAVRDHIRRKLRKTR